MATGGGSSFPVVDVSRDQGKTFPRPTDVLPPARGNWGDRDFITAGPHGLAYLTWDYALGPAQEYFTSSVNGGTTWPGDTFGIATLPGGAPGQARSLVLTWSSAVSANSRIYAAPVSL